MKKVCLIAALATCVTFTSGYGVAQPRSFTELAAQGGQPAPSSTPSESMVSAAAVDLGGGVTSYTDEAEFQAASGILTVEDFVSTRFVTPNTTCATQTPVLSSATDDSCYAPGDLEPGYIFEVINDLARPELWQYVYTTPPLYWSVPTIGPDDFFDDTQFTFSPAVRAVSVRLIGAVIPFSGVMEIFDASDASLGSVAVDLTAGQVGFFGFTSSAAMIARLTVTSAGGAELFDNLQFATNLAPPSATPVPAIPLLGLLLLAGGAGLIGIRRFRKGA